MAVGAGGDEHRGGSPAVVGLELRAHENDGEDKGADTMCGSVLYKISRYSSVSDGVIREMITLPDSTSTRARARAALAGSLNWTNECTACVWAGCAA